MLCHGCASTAASVKVPTMTLHGAKLDDLNSGRGDVMKGSITDNWHTLHLKVGLETFDVEYQEVHNTDHPDYKYALRTHTHVESTRWNEVFFGGNMWHPGKVVLAYPTTPKPLSREFWAVERRWSGGGAAVELWLARARPPVGLRFGCGWAGVGVGWPQPKTPAAENPSRKSP
eukprot:858771-Rhodomonas_salina.1